MKTCYKEIGSEFYTVETCSKNNSFFEQDTSWYISGRSALKAIIEDLSSKISFSSIAMPSWCCESMIKPFVDFGIEVNFYPVLIRDGKLFQGVFDAKKSDVLFLFDYFGYEGNDSLPFEGPVIRDLTHSLFTKTYNDADYYFGSLRKWSGFLTGGFARGVTEKHLPLSPTYAQLRKKAMEMKKSYIEDGVGDKSYLSLYKDAEKLLEEVTILGAEESDMVSASMLDVERIKRQRRENAELLISELSDFVLFNELGERDCPLFVPLLVPSDKRDALRRHLIEEGIFCPIHWPISKYHRLSQAEESIYNRELSLVCDQRYGPDDMERTVKIIKNFFKR